jgi:anti-sigma-K factor RskA
MERDMTCADIDLLLAAQAVGSLEADEVPVLEQHLGGCERCRKAAAEYAAVVAVLPLTLEPRDPPPALRTQLMARVYAEAAAPKRTPGLRERLRHLWDAIPASRGLTVSAAMAAATAVSLLGWNLATRPTPPPESAVVQVSGTTVAPSVHGTLTYDPRSRQAVLTVKGLVGPPTVPRSGPGANSYEVWLIRADNSVVAAAYLTLAPDGHTWTAAIDGDLSRYVSLAATVEPPGGSRTPTGPEVIHTVLSGLAAI